MTTPAQVAKRAIERQERDQHRQPLRIIRRPAGRQSRHDSRMQRGPDRSHGQALTAL
jgi:hypothetical protein